MSTILIAGFQHETNTFAPRATTWENFVNGEGYPRLHTESEVLALREVNVPIGGFIDAADDWILAPVLWCAASPSGPVTTPTFERIAGAITDACERIRPDAVYLDLHGAMVTEAHDDGDGELLGRLRRIVGPDVPIVASLDLHANVSDTMLAVADALVAYRTYPHVDMAQTGRSAADLLRVLLSGTRLSWAAEHLDFLIPVNSASTLTAPAREIYAELEDERMWCSFAAGFPAADIPFCRPTVFAYGPDPAAVRARVAELRRLVDAREERFVLDALPAPVAVRRAVELVGAGRGPVVIADTQDNPGAGGDATSTGLLAALVQADAPNSALAAMWDPGIVATATDAGAGARIPVVFPGSGVTGDGPMEAEFEVEALSSGRVVFDGPMLHSTQLEVGPSVVLRHGHVRVVVNSHKAQVMDRNQFRHAGVDPDALDILVVKSSVHFRADFASHAAEVLVALAPGPVQADPADYPWSALAPGVRTHPGGVPFTP